MFVLHAKHHPCKDVFSNVSITNKSCSLIVFYSSPIISPKTNHCKNGRHLFQGFNFKAHRQEGNAWLLTSTRQCTWGICNIPNRSQKHGRVNRQKEKREICTSANMRLGLQDAKDRVFAHFHCSKLSLWKMWINKKDTEAVQGMTEGFRRWLLLDHFGFTMHLIVWELIWHCHPCNPFLHHFLRFAIGLFCQFCRTSINGLMGENIIVIDVTRVRFPADERHVHVFSCWFSKNFSESVWLRLKGWELFVHGWLKKQDLRVRHEDTSRPRRSSGAQKLSCPKPQ